MSREIFQKILSRNDVGATGGHQGGILVPKAKIDLIAFLPPLNPTTKNPDAWITCVDEDGNELQFRYVYYNNRLHDEGGTRNEYRITYMTRFFRDVGAKAGDAFEISRGNGDRYYRIRIERAATTATGPKRIKLLGWRRIH